MTQKIFMSLFIVKSHAKTLPHIDGFRFHRVHAITIFRETTLILQGTLSAWCCLRDDCAIFDAACTPEK